MALIEADDVPHSRMHRTGRSLSPELDCAFRAGPQPESELGQPICQILLSPFGMVLWLMFKHLYQQRYRSLFLWCKFGAVQDEAASSISAGPENSCLSFRFYRM